MLDNYITQTTGPKKGFKLTDFARSLLNSESGFTKVFIALALHNEKTQSNTEEILVNTFLRKDALFIMNHWTIILANSAFNQN